jgi:hypothetical protein
MWKAFVGVDGDGDLCLYLLLSLLPMAKKMPGMVAL